MKGNAFNSQSIKFMAILWVTQEILKLVPANPPWPKLAGQMQLIQIIKWNNMGVLEIETAKNTQLLLRHTRLILGTNTRQSTTSVVGKEYRSTVEGTKLAKSTLQNVLAMFRRRKRSR